MKTKYVKIPVSERLPEKSGKYLVYHKGFMTYLQSNFSSSDPEKAEYYKENIEWWLEEKEDHSEEMLSLLQRILDLNVLPAEIDDEVISLTLKVHGYDMSHIDKISMQGFGKVKQLINKVKDNGK